MELRHLRYFKALAETLNFTRAAESLYISQSTLSQQIGQLEKEVGVKLFERGHHQVTLTDAGRKLLSEASSILYRIDALPELAEGTHISKVTNTITVGFDKRVLGSKFLKDAVAACIYNAREDQPNLQVHFRCNEYDQTIQDLRSGTIDVAFFLHQQPTMDNATLTSKCLYKDELVAAIHTPDPVEDTPEDLERIVMKRGVTLLESEARGLMQTLMLFEDLGIEPPIHFANDRTAMLLSLNSGERPAILPKGLVSQIAAPDTKIARFRRREAMLYVLAVWQTSNTNPLIGHLVKDVETAFAHWVEKREEELKDYPFPTD